MIWRRVYVHVEDRSGDLPWEDIETIRGIEERNGLVKSFINLGRNSGLPCDYFMGFGECDEDDNYTFKFAKLINDEPGYRAEVVDVWSPPTATSPP